MRGLLRCIALATAALALTACAAVTDGSPAPHTTLAPTAASSKAPPAPYQRQIVSSTLGDLALLDLCAGIDLRTFAKWGTASLHGWQEPGRCLVDVDSGGTYFQIDAGFGDSYDLPPDGQMTQLDDGNSTYTFPARGKDCERAYSYQDLLVDIHIVDYDGMLNSATHCAVADSYLHAQIQAFAAATVTSRPLASPLLLVWTCAH